MNRSIVSTFLVLISLAACSDKKAQTPTKAPPSVVARLQDIQFDSEKASDEQKQLIQLIQTGSDQVTQVSAALLLKQHADSFNNDRNNSTQEITAEDLKTLITNTNKQITATNFSELKASVDNELKVSTYNKTATSMGHILVDKKLQCYSGTMLFLELALDKFGSLENTESIVIMEEGHVLPGFITKESGRSILTGIETTATGSSSIDYGFADELSKIDRKMRVFLAGDFLAIEALKDLVVDKSAALTILQQRAKDKYGIALSSVEEDNVSPASNSSRDINSTFLGFGESKMPTGDLAMQPSKFKSYRLVTNANLTTSASLTMNNPYDSKAKPIQDSLQFRLSKKTKEKNARLNLETIVINPIEIHDYSGDCSLSAGSNISPEAPSTGKGRNEEESIYTLNGKKFYLFTSSRPVSWSNQLSIQALISAEKIELIKANLTDDVSAAIDLAPTDIYLLHFRSQNCLLYSSNYTMLDTVLGMIDRGP